MTDDRTSFFIDGTWRTPAGTGSVETRCAASGELLGGYPESTAADVDAAVDAARAAYDDPAGWASWTGAQRADVMERLADAIERRYDAIATLIAREVGSTLEFAGAANAAASTGHLRYYAKLAREFEPEQQRPTDLGHTLVRRVPVGVVGMIVPWNYPLSLITFKLGPAMAAGCTAVVKPAPETGLDSYLFADAVEEAGVPAGVINIVPAGREVGEHLVTHPRVDKIAFTGSTAAGKRIGGLCGELLRPVTLELGGKSAAILLDDADLPKFLDSLGFITFSNNGQTCTNNTRILAPRARYDEVVEAVSSRVSGYVVGDPRDPETEVGPLISERQRDRVESYMAAAVEDGARTTAGGGRPVGLDNGWYVEPTVYADVTPDDRIFREEIFGPVVSITPYDGGDDAAVELANDSDYGLSGTVWSSDDDRALAVAKRLRTGTVGVNMWMLDLASPFAGWKQSGLGCELGPEGLDQYLAFQSLSVGSAADANATARAAVKSGA